MYAYTQIYGCMPWPDMLPGCKTPTTNVCVCVCVCVYVCNVMYVCNVCMYVLCLYVCVCMHVYVHVCVHAWGSLVWPLVSLGYFTSASYLHCSRWSWSAGCPMTTLKFCPTCSFAPRACRVHSTSCSARRCSRTWTRSSRASCSPAHS